ncbi:MULTISPECIES: mycofactocin precursor MftA [Allobranchiibius]|uniref:Mycofactocin n=1 Tax=Allobranchiibius huperziae TaxID=1874116 RepID=A0A853DN35_9MICO|nr:MULTISPECIES: mycofactocin precursor MftA [Allobranchiibius]NYJ76030.1 mycofactocin precursor [Allobranchiibius huperziae]UIJ35856.1 mycofactocin precursor MftA [Allobranchiibius sp. GilTou73]
MPADLDQQEQVADTQVEDRADEAPVEESLVEDVSIDGMCGVY